MPSNFVDRGADAYEAHMGRWSRRLAVPFLDFAGIEPGERVADVGCGTGNLALAMLERGAAHIEAIDYSEAFVASVQERHAGPRLSVRQGDACALPYPDAAFDRALSMLVFHFVSDPIKAARELRRVIRPGGVAAATVWDTYGGMPSVRAFWDTAAALEPTAHARRAAQSMKPMTRQGDLVGAFEAAGLRDVSETLLTIRMDFADFDDFWAPTTRGHGANATFMDSLTPQMQARIEAAVRDAYLCGAPDGPRSFVSAAWAARGVAP